MLMIPKRAKTNGLTSSGIARPGSNDPEPIHLVVALTVQTLPSHDDSNTEGVTNDGTCLPTPPLRSVETAK